MARRPDRLPDPQDVVSGKARARIEQLFALIHEVNPTDKGLPAREKASRYALKSKLQAVLVRNHADVLEVVAHPTDPAVVSFRHRQADRDAAHAVLAELDDDTRRWAETQLLLAKLPDRPVEPVKMPLSAFERPTPRTVDALARGHAAVEAWDYEAAREAFTEAITASRGGPDAARALLDLLVNALADDAAALGVEDLLSARALDDREIRGMLALASARMGDRDRARRLGRDSGSADLLVLLAGLAIRDGDVGDAASIVLALRELDAAHPALMKMSEGILRLKADERRPAEAELAAAMERGDDAEIEGLARSLLARWSTSELARMALAGVDGRRRSAEASRLAAEAWASWSRGDAVQAGALARRARALGVNDPEMAVWLAEAEAAAAEVTENAAIQFAIGEVGKDRFEGYLALSADARGRVQERAERPMLAWVESLGRTPEAVSAALALEAALANPVAAAARLRPHDRLLRTLPEARRFIAALEADAEKTAKRRFIEQVDAAEDAYLRGELDRAAGLVAGLDLRSGTGAEGARYRELIRALGSDQATASSQRRVEERVSAGDLLGARDLASASGLPALAADIAERVRAHWRVRTFTDASLLEGALLDAAWPETVPYPRLSLTPDARQICIGEAHNGEVFVRVIDRDSMKVERALRLRTPTPLDWRADQLIDGRLYILGSRGAVLVVDFATLDVVAWYPDVLPPRPSTATIEMATMAPGVRYLWLTVRDDAERVECRVYDLERWPRFRKMDAAGRPFALWGAADPTIALLQPGLGLRLHSPSGNPRMQRAILSDIAITRVTAHPTQIGVLGVADARNMKNLPGMPAVFADMPNAVNDPLAVFVLKTDNYTFSASGISSARSSQPHVLATSRATERVWMRLCINDTVQLCPVGFLDDGEMDSEGSQFAPRNTVLMQDASGEHVAAVYCTPDGLAEQPLPFSPARTDETGAAIAHLTVWSQFNGLSRVTGCGADRNWISEGAASLAKDLAKVPASEREVVGREYLSSFAGDSVALADLIGALSTVGLGGLAEEVLATLERELPDSPQARAFRGIHALHLRAFNEARTLLAALNTAALPPRMAQHVRHARVLVAIEDGDFGGAEQELDATPDLPDGCDLRGLRVFVAVRCGRPPPDQVEDAVRWEQISGYLKTMETADTCLATADWEGAWSALNRAIVWRTIELEPLSRLTAAVLGRGVAGFMEEMAVASFLEKCVEREMVFAVGGGRGTTTDVGYAELAVRARAWLDAVTMVSARVV